MLGILKDMSFSQVLKTQVDKFGNKEAIYDLNERITYAEIEKRANQLAAGLVKLGIKKGDRVAVSLPNWSETIIIYFACAKIGAVVVPFNPGYRSHETQHILTDSQPQILFLSEKFLENIDLAIVTSIVKQLITVRFDVDGFLNITDLMKSNSTQVFHDHTDVDQDLFCILYTSGTTGLPKGVMITHRSIVQCAITIANEMNCSEKDTFIVPAPLFHIFGITCNLMASIVSGARIVLMERFHPEKVLKLIEQERVTVHLGVPTMFLKELEVEDFEKYNISSLRVGMTGASPITPYQMKMIREKLNFNLCQSFGITEAGTVTFTSSKSDERTILETLGKPIPGVELKIVDENRQTLPKGKVGEIAIKSFANMKGYYNLPEQTKAVMDNEGFYYTGDLGKLDSEGNLIFVGRKKEMIIRGGYNIYPQEIEGVLMKHPKISNAAIIGLPDEVLGEFVCAVIQLKNGEVLSEEDVKSYLSNHLAKYKLPSKIIFTDQLPVTASGKIQKLKLKKQLLDTIEAG